MLSLAFNIEPVRAGESPFNGYTLFAPLGSTTTYLINNSGEIVHTWDSDYNLGLSVYLLENGNLLRTAYEGGGGDGAGGRVQEIEWDGTVIWGYDCSSEQHRRHAYITERYTCCCGCATAIANNNM